MNELTGSTRIRTMYNDKLDKWIHCIAARLEAYLYTKQFIKED